MSNVAIIPARLKSTRFPNKIIQNFNGKRIIDHVIENTFKLDFVDDVIIATDDKEFGEEIKKEYTDIKSSFISEANCGTHRLYQYFDFNPFYKNYISIPCDEPSINYKEINKTFKKIKKIEVNEIITFYTKFFCKEDLESPLSCKIVSDDKDYMIYNSRAIVPILKTGQFLPLEQYKKHLGIFIFPRTVMIRYDETLWNDTTDIESLEQNRFLQKHVGIKMYETNHIGFGIDVPSQIKELEERIKCQK